MHETAQGVVQNLLDFVEAFGFVPNGGRVYYLTRSQPPLLSEMVLAVYNATGNRSFAAQAVGRLDQEYAYWMSPVHAVTVPPAHTLNRYNAQTRLPRPESFR